MAPIEYCAFNEHIGQFTQGLYFPPYIKSHHDVVFELQEADFFCFGRYMDFSPSPLEYTIECSDGEGWERRQLFDVL